MNEQLAQSVKDTIGSFRCKKCPKGFRNQQGLNMHVIRMHSNRGWNTAPNFRPKKKKYPSDGREYRRQVYLRSRQRNWERGLTSQGRVPVTRIRPYVHKPGAEETTTPSIKYCPHCGTNIEKYL